MRTRRTRALVVAAVVGLATAGPAGPAGAQGVGGGGAISGGNTVTVMGTYTEAAPVASAPSGGGGAVPALPGAGAVGGGGGTAPTFAELPVSGTCGMLAAAGGGECGPIAPSAPAAGPAAPAPPPIDWLAVARGVASDAAATIGIEAIDIGIVPEDIDGRVGLVGMPVWMWVENPSPETVGPMQKVVTSGPVVVTLNATMMAVGWDMGDGGHQLCPGVLAPYTPYTDVAADSPSPTCGYRYTRSSLRQPGEKFEVTASSTWQVTWTATTPAGMTGGVIPMARSSSTSIKVGESQVLVLPGRPGA